MDIRLDEGFLFGMGVFETVAVEQGRPLLLEQHLNRMQGSADFLKLGSCAERGLTKEKIAEYLSTQEMSVKMHGALKIRHKSSGIDFIHIWIFSHLKEGILS